MSLVLRATPVVLVAALVQVTVLAGERLLGAEIDLLLVTVVVIGTLRGATAGAIAGFAGGLLVDVMTLSTLGVTSLLLTLAGYWAGRYGETTGRGRAFAAPLAAFVLTILVGLAAAALHFLLGDAVPAGAVLGPLLPSALLAAILAVLVRRACGSFLRASSRADRVVHDVELVR